MRVSPAILVLTVILCRVAAAEQLTRPPNILLIVVDDLGYGELGCQGNEQIPTPHIDSIANSGVRFTNGYVTASYCSPSRAGILTGRYQTRFGHELNPTGDHNFDPDAGLPLTEWTLAEQLHKAGYATGLVGKWHLGAAPGSQPQRQGFDEFYGFLHEGHSYVPPPYQGVTSFLRRRHLPEGEGPRWREGNVIWTSHMKSNEPTYDLHNPLLRGAEPVVEKAYLTDAFTREAVAFINRHQHESFFLELSYNAVHSPMQASDSYMKQFADIKDIHRRVFAAMLAQLDDGIGQVLKTLRDAGLDEKTLIIFISDNGGPTRELTSSNHPLRGGKGSLYEGGIRIPFFIKWTGEIPAGLVYKEPVISADIFATASAAAEIELPKDRKIDGVNLPPYLQDEITGPPHHTLYWRMGNKAALRHGDWKIVGRTRARDDTMHFELYNLAADPSEMMNLAGKKAERLAELTHRWRELNDQMVEPNWRRER